MAVPDRTGVPIKTSQTEQYVLNYTFDEAYKIMMVGLAAFNATTGTYDRLQINSSGQLVTNAGGSSGGTATSVALNDGTTTTRTATVDTNGRLYVRISNELDGSLLGRVVVSNDTNSARMAINSDGSLNVKPGTVGQTTMSASAPVTIASDQSPLPFKDIYSPTPFSMTVAGASTTLDVSGTGYSYASVHITSQGTASTVTFQTSNDGTNWVSQVLQLSTNVTGTVSASTGSSGVMYAGAVFGRYFRVNVTGITAGTTAGNILLTREPLTMTAISGQVAINGTASVNTNFGGNAQSPSPLSFYFNAALGATATQIVSGIHRLHTFHFYNPNGAVVFVQFFNTLSTGVTLGTTPPVQSYAVPAGGIMEDQFVIPHNWSTAITIAVTTTANGATAPTTGIVVNLGYI